MATIAYLWPNKLHERNRARYQRAISLSRTHEVILITRGTQPQNDEILSAVSNVYHSPAVLRSNYVDNLVYYVYALGLIIYLRLWGRLQVLHTFPGPSTHLGALCKVALGTRWVVDVLDDPSVERDSLQGRRPLLKYLAYTLHVQLAELDFRLADRVIVVGWSTDKGLPAIISGNYNVQKGRILPVPNGVDLKGTNPENVEPSSSTDEFVIFYVGSIKRIRGIDVLIRAFAKFNASAPDSRLEVLGPVRDKRDQADIEILLRDLDIESDVEFPASRVDHGEVLKRMKEADICVLPLSEEIANYRYTFPIKLFEYLSMSKPVVATRLDGVSRVIEDGYNGLLVEPGNVDDMAHAFSKFYHDVALRNNCETNARDSIRSYDWQTVNRPVCRMYDELVDTYP